MRPLQVPIIRTAFLLAGAVMMLSGGALAINKPSQSFILNSLPKIDLKPCIQVENAIGHNPNSPIPNDLLLVTKYEEKPDNNGAMKRGLEPGRALNMYLVVSAWVSPENQESGVVHNTLLIVKLSTRNPSSSKETVREWIFVDEDGDRTVNGGVYRETVIEDGKEPITSTEVNFPENSLKKLQAYYERAALALKGRSEAALREACVIT